MGCCRPGDPQAEEEGDRTKTFEALRAARSMGDKARGWRAVRLPWAMEYHGMLFFFGLFFFFLGGAVFLFLFFGHVFGHVFASVLAMCLFASLFLKGVFGRFVCVVVFLVVLQCPKKNKQRPSITRTHNLGDQHGWV